jgi:5-methyltetrahydrofolate--homocysteine methyltransferase
MPILTEIAAHIERGDSAKVNELTRLALSQRYRPERILDDALIAGMSAVGERFKNNEIFIPEVLIASRAMNAGLEVLRPHFSPELGHFKKKIVLATVKGDLHDIGKKIVGMMLEGAGYIVVDLGINVPKRTIVQAVSKNRPVVLGLSALLTTTMSYMREVIESVERAGLRRRARIVIGGAPVTQAYADEIGADGYAPNAASGLDLIKSLTSRKRGR